MSRKQLIFICIALLTILVIRFFLVFTDSSTYKPGQKISFRSTLASEPQVFGNNQRFILRDISIVTARFPEYHYGDELSISGTLSQARLQDGQANLSKIKGRVLDKIEPDFIMFFPKIERERNGLLALGGNLRQHVNNTFSYILPSSLAALLSGIVLGSKEDFSPQFKEALKNTGTLHVVAASGMNVSILASFLMGVFLRVLPRRPVGVIVLLGIFFYTLLASFEPSIVRAAIMGGLVFTASLMGRAALPAWGLTLAGYSMLLIDPKLLFDIGFQLSFAATGGLLFLKPILEHGWLWFAKLGTVPVIGDSFTTTIVAQAATLPILLSNFGTVSLISIIVNTLVLWVVGPIMVLGIVGAMLSAVSYLAWVPIILTLPLLSFFEAVVKFFNRPEFLFTFEMPFVAGVGYYCVFVGWYLFLRKNET